MALDVLSDALVNHQSSPLRLALQDANIGKDVYAWVDDSKQNVFSIIVKNANPADQQEFERILFNTMNEAAENGFDDETIEGIVNRTEFRLRE
jgi:hypothetical protein